MENLKKMKECLIGVAENQVYGNLDQVNAKELGEVMDMIKDLSEAVYYCTITESMEEAAREEYMPYPMGRPESRYAERAYPSNGARAGGSSMPRGGAGGRASGSTRNYMDGMIRRYDDGAMSYSMYREPMEYPYYEDMHAPMMRDPREGRSGERRKMYMEGKGYKDKTKQMQELEAYMQELASDMTEMIQDASPEEKQFLQTKIATLASKVK